MTNLKELCYTRTVISWTAGGPLRLRSTTERPSGKESMDLSTAQMSIGSDPWNIETDSLQVLYNH
jgi:hypothetical protein